MGFVLGIDLGTSACKVALLGQDGTRHGTVSSGYQVRRPAPGWSEQDPRDWWNAVCSATTRLLQTSELDPDDVRGIGLAGQMHSTVVLDGAGSVLRPAILWSDQRSGDECDEVGRSVRGVTGITLNPLIPAFTLPQLLWIRNHESATYRQVKHVLLAKDWIRLRMTGRYATDESDASGTAMFDVAERRWSDHILEALDIPRDWLPECLPSAQPGGELNEAAATAMGLRSGTPVFAGAGDQIAQAVANGVIEPGVIGVTIGTSGVVVESLIAPANGSFCHAIADRWLHLDSMHSAGVSLTWLRDVLGDQRPISDLIAAAGTVDAGSDGLIFLPFLAGARYESALATPSAFVGLRTMHGGAHFVRAILEGVTHELRRMVDARRRTGGPPPAIHLSGGGSRSALWRQIVADSLQLPVLTTGRGAADGAALLAGVGLGWWGSLALAAAATDIQVVITVPEATGVGRLNNAYDAYLDSVGRLAVTELALGYAQAAVPSAAVEVSV